MKTFVTVLGAAIALFALSSGEAKAGHYGCNSYRGGYSYSAPSYYRSSPSYYGNYNSYYSGRSYSNYPSYRGSYYHDTSHYDYHPTTVVPHGNHLHVIPGHYDYHQTGHWHH